jgi:hypothetical protein
MGYDTANEELKKIVGSTVKGLEDSGDMTLLLEDGRRVRMTLTGDCCSSSSFTEPKQFQELVGATILEAEDRDGQSDNNLPEPEGSDVISWHFLVFKTNKGHVTIDWHNDSNGYYDGNLSVEIT